MCRLVYTFVNSKNIPRKLLFLLPLLSLSTHSHTLLAAVSVRVPAAVPS